MPNDLISIVIPMYNEEKDIGHCMKSLSKQTYKKIEVILVDDGSTDSTIKIANKTAEESGLKIKILNQKHQGPGKARNLGANMAKGNVLVFVDSDMAFDKDYVKNLVKPINEKIIGTTHDNEIVLNTKNIWSACWGGVRVSPKNAKEVKIFRAIKKKEFLSKGGFDPKYGYADDQTLWFKYGMRPTVAPNTICYHRNPTRLKQVFTQSRWIGASLDLRIAHKPVISELFFILSIIFSPLIIPVLSLVKCVKLRKSRLILPMLAFMTMRYFGSLAGLMRSRYTGSNWK